MRRLVFSLCALLALAACAAEPIWAPDDAVARARYSDPGPASLTLFTVVSNRSGDGGHTSLMVNGTQRIIFDPAGTWESSYAPERNDVHFGMTPAVLDNYVDYHTRITWHTIEQTVVVSPDVAAQAALLVERYGAVEKAMCAESVSSILVRLPGFEQLPRTWFPVTLSKAFAGLPGVKTRVYYDTDPDINTPKLDQPFAPQAVGQTPPA